MTAESAICFCSVCLYLQDACSLGHALQYTGLIAVLEEDGPVVINIPHLDKHGGCACPPAACWTIVWNRFVFVFGLFVQPQKQTH